MLTRSQLAHARHEVAINKNNNISYRVELRGLQASIHHTVQAGSYAFRVLQNGAAAAYASSAGSSPTKQRRRSASAIPDSSPLPREVPPCYHMLALGLG